MTKQETKIFWKLVKKFPTVPLSGFNFSEDGYRYYYWGEQEEDTQTEMKNFIESEIKKAGAV